MKISPEMVAGFGGVESQQFSQFMSYLISCYLQVRRDCNLILALLILLRESGIKVVEEDIVKNFDWMVQRMNLSLDDEEASINIVQVVYEQLSALFPKFLDSMHRWIQ